MKTKTITKCKECAWSRPPIYEGFVWCSLKELEVWAESEACNEASDIGVI